MIERAGLYLALGIALLLGAQLVLPVTVSHATSGSMAPTIDEGDAYLVVESATVGVDDVITYYSHANNEYVTHRVVDRTEHGFITKGDANRRSDQAAGAPVVYPSTVLGTVLSVDGQPVTVPVAGKALTAIQVGNGWLAGGLLVLLVLDVLYGRRSRRPDRELLRVRDVASVLLAGAFVWCLIVVALSGSEHEFAYVVSGEETPADHTVLPGETATQRFSFTHRPSPATTVVLDTARAELVERRTDGSEISALIRTPPRDSIGAYRATVRTRVYPATLPEGILRTFHGAHWFLAAVASLLPVFVPLTGAYFLVLDGGSPIRLAGRRGSTWAGGDRP